MSDCLRAAYKAAGLRRICTACSGRRVLLSRAKPGGRSAGLPLRPALFPRFLRCSQGFEGQGPVGRSVLEPGAGSVILRHRHPSAKSGKAEARSLPSYVETLWSYACGPVRLVPFSASTKAQSEVLPLSTIKAVSIGGIHAGKFPQSR